MLPSTWFLILRPLKSSNRYVPRIFNSRTVFSCIYIPETAKVGQTLGFGTRKQAKTAATDRVTCKTVGRPDCIERPRVTTSSNTHSNTRAAFVAQDLFIVSDTQRAIFIVSSFSRLLGGCADAPARNKAWVSSTAAKGPTWMHKAVQCITDLRHNYAKLDATSKRGSCEARALRTKAFPLDLVSAISWYQLISQQSIGQWLVFFDWSDLFTSLTAQRSLVTPNDLFIQVASSAIWIRSWRKQA